jgi:hypothetical protein
MKRMWRKHGTKILGMAAAIWSGFLAIEGFFPPAHVKYALAVNVVLGVLTLQRGIQNGKAPAP